jgi:GTPase SAR1 family protein
MGLCGSSLTEDEKRAMDVSKNIDKTITTNYTKTQDIIKLLLLGAGESGKSTIFKQMKILYGQGYSESDRQEFKKFVHSNTIEAMRTLCMACESLGYFDQLRAKEEYKYFVALPDNACFGSGVNLTSQISQMIRVLWTDPAIQSTWALRSRIQVPDASQYYFNAVDRISSPGYVPSIEDVLRSRVRTSGVVEEHYTIDGSHFLFVDVGGQRNERKKWLHCFDDVKAVIFVCALSEYDQSLFESETTNE